MYTVWTTDEQKQIHPFFSPNTPRKSICSGFGIKEKVELGKYLGITLQASRVGKQTYNFLEEKTRRKMSGSGCSTYLNQGHNYIMEYLLENHSGHGKA